MYANDQRDRDAAGAAVDLSFSQILEAHSWQQQYQQRHRKHPPRAPTGTNGRIMGRPPLSNGIASTGRSVGGNTLHILDELEEEHDESTAPPSHGRSQSGRGRHPSDTSDGEEEAWAWGSGTSSDGAGGVPPAPRSATGDMYRFVQPRRLSSWVQDDAVNACFKCHTHFTLLLRKHHCRACGRIFCATCSSQRVVIPGDYESTPVAPTSNSLTSNASDLIGNLSWYLWSGPESTSGSNRPHHHDHHASDPDDVASSHWLTAEERQEKFLKDIQRLQEAGIVSKFTPCRTRSGSTTSVTSSTKSSYVPDGSVLQRVCDDCAAALQQRRQHYNIVKVFELCEFNLKELRVLGQVCRKWHRASIMCLSMFRQIQYYLPSHRLSDREKALLIINRGFLSGHTKWMLQLIKAIDFSSDFETSPLAKEVLTLMRQPRKHKCMLTMCSRLCQPELKSVDALEILADETIRNAQLRAMSVEALLKTATEKEWTSFLPVLLHSLSGEPNAANSKLGQALIRQAQCDVRLCYDLYWGLTVMAEDATCRRKFDALKQRLLLTLTQLKHNTMPLLTLRKHASHPHDDITEQLLRGQEFVDLMYRVPPRIPVKDVREQLEQSVERSGLFGSVLSASLSDDDSIHPRSVQPPLLRLPVDPFVRVGGINFKTIEVKRSAEAPMILTCTGVERDEDDGGEEKQRRRSRGGSSTGGTELMGSASAVGSGDAPVRRPSRTGPSALTNQYRIMYKRDDLRKDAIVQNIINVMYLILHQETRLDIPLVTYRVLPTSSFDGLIEIVENAHTLYSIIRDHGSILNFLHHYNGHRTLSEISTSFRESLAAYTVITFLLGVGDRHADNVMLTKDGILFHIDYGFILGKDPKPLQPPMRLDHYMIEALGGAQTAQFEQFKQLCVIAFNCLRRHVSLFMIMLSLVVKAIPEITDFDMNYTQSDLEAFVIERFLPGQTDDEAAMALMLRMEGKLNEKIGLKLSDFVHAHANEKTVSKSIGSVGSSVKVGVEAVSTVASSITSSASSLYNYVWGGSS